MIKILDKLIERLSKSFPHLSIKLKQAGMKDTPEEFIKKTITISLVGTVGIKVFLLLLLARLHLTKIILLLFPIVLTIMLFYFFRVPEVRIAKKIKEINSEIIFAGRFLIIELESGVPLYNAFKNISKNYEIIGKYFTEITTKIDLGTEMEAALDEAIEFTPSPNFRRILWQIINAQKTGADISTSLKSVVDQITKEHMIEIEEYGRKLNPLAMFYMIIAVILPSIGITMFIVLSTFLNLTLNLVALIAISVFLGFIQFMFLAMIKSSRPSGEI